VNRWKKSLALKITQCGTPPANQEGQCGNNNHDLADDTPAILEQKFGGKVPEMLLLFPDVKKAAAKKAKIHHLRAQ